MSAVAFLSAWANVPFAIAALVAVVFGLLQITGALALLGGHGDAAHGGAGHEVAHGAAAGHEVAHGAGAAHHHGAGHAARHGAGKLPFSVAWQAFALAFAATGFGANLHYFGASGVPLYSLAWTVPAAVAVGAAVVALVARMLAPVLSTEGQEATSRAELVGQIGVVISSRVDDEFGEVRIRDRTGHDLRVVCKLPKGSREPIGEHRRVVVVDSGSEGGELLVEALDDGLEEPRDEKRDATKAT